MRKYQIEVNEAVDQLLSESSGVVTKARKKIAQYKKRLINKWKTKGPHENFGEAEYRK